jgi:hypothetical protein
VLFKGVKRRVRRVVVPWTGLFGSQTVGPQAAVDKANPRVTVMTQVIDSAPLVRIAGIAMEGTLSEVNDLQQRMRLARRDVECLRGRRTPHSRPSGDRDRSACDQRNAVHGPLLPVGHRVATSHCPSEEQKRRL